MQYTIHTMTRIAGDARLLTFTDNNGIVTDAFINTTLSNRNFTSFAKNKNPHFVLEGVKRICGVCHAVQGTVCCKAFEDAMGISVPEGGVLLRELCTELNRLQSHSLAQIMLTDDIFASNVIPEIKENLFKLYKSINTAMECAGGAMINLPHLVIGGMSKELTKTKLAKLNTLISYIEELLIQYIENFKHSTFMSEEYIELKSIEKSKRFLAIGLFSYDKSKIDLNFIEILPNIPTNEQSIKGIKKNKDVVATYKGNSVEVGPRARLSLFKDFKGKGLTGINEARVREMILSIEQIKKILKKIYPNDKVMADDAILKKGESTIVFEAPRGTLIHSIKIGNNLKVSEYNIIFPTMFNILIIQEILKGMPVRLSKIIIRLYDPCIPCEVH
ncbi:MAG: hypothetical protein HF967_08725 [Methanosarcinales archaeon]|nr:hypothetical protein [Methanosarcinales archaeon]